MSASPSSPQTTYELLDSGGGRKLERFGAFVVARPCAQAVWRTSLPESAWKGATASFSREGGNRWDKRGALPDSWPITIDGLAFKLLATDFGHLGVFPEQRPLWRWVEEAIAGPRRPASLLNLFAYSGGATLAAARAGARVTHVDASKGMVALAAENARLNGLDESSARWIVDDVGKFLAREGRRGNRYDAVILDPPTFGRGAKGEVFKIERDLPELLDACGQLLSGAPLFVLLTCHTPGYTPIVLEHVLRQALGGPPGVGPRGSIGGGAAAAEPRGTGAGSAAPAPRGTLLSGEMTLRGGPGVLPIPSGTFASWRPAA